MVCICNTVRSCSKEYGEVNTIIQLVHGINRPDPDLDKFFQVMSAAGSDSAKDPYGS